MQPSKLYTDPQLITANAKDWYIFLRFFHAGKWHPRKYREGINRIADKKKRKAEAGVLKEARKL